ncbi:class I tRNA ligase family protein [Actinophytocola sp.]|uniref:class I tRNA ligase family protein n=1 Tax=Actinophytocola sp. TaxID=1872138 RepID=UPI002ED6047C
MIISTYSAEALRESFGIDMSAIDMGPVESMGVGAAWGRVAPGVHSDPHQHDETETFVIVAGTGELIVDAGRRPVEPGMVLQFEPFETHYLDNTGDTDLVFATFYWRDTDRAVPKAGEINRRRFDQRPIFVFSSPTTPNGDLHLGHLSGPYLGADAFVRYQQMNGVRAWHIAGSDDFQSWVVGTARREGRSPAETAAHYSAEILATHRMMDIDVHEYTVSNQDPTYLDGLRAFFSRVAASPLVEPREGPALFDGADGSYLYEGDISGGCPTCGNGTSGNMCEDCGEPNFSFDLTEPRATSSDASPRVGDITRYMLALHELRADIETHHHLGRVPARVKELTNRVFQRDRIDLAISHPGEWGVEPPKSEVDGQVIWVWVDMAYRFLHGIESIGRRVGEDWRADAPRENWKIVHFLGYDNTFYHSIFCPAMYRLAYPDWHPDIDYNLNEFYRLDGSKFSTSRRHAVWGKDVLGPHSVDAVRFYLSLTRPEGRGTNFELAAYEEFTQETLVGGWQRWLNDLGARIDKHYGGKAPDAGIWTPEHTAFLARLESRRLALTGSLGQDGFSLNAAAEALSGIVTDATAFAAREAAMAEIPEWKDEARTAIALELAAARLLATCAAPVIPRFAGKLSAALGLPEPAVWPHTVPLVPAGTRVDLAGQVFFGARPEPSALLPWLSELVRSTLRLPENEWVDDKTLVGLGMESLQAVALQYQITAHLGADITVEELMGSRSVAELATLLDNGVVPDTVAVHA